MSHLLLSLTVVLCTLSCSLFCLESHSELRELCEFINKTDFRIKNIYHLLPKKGGDRLLKQLNLYNDAFSKLVDYVISNNSTIKGECQYVLKHGAARYFYALYDDELLKYFFKWTPPYTKNKGKYEDMLDFRVEALEMWNKLHEFLDKTTKQTKMISRNQLKLLCAMTLTLTLVESAPKPFIGKLSQMGNAVRNIGASLFNKLSGGQAPPLPPSVTEGDILRQLEFMNKMLKQVRGFIMSPSPLIREKMRPYTQTLIDQIIPQFEQLKFTNEELKTIYKMRPEDIVKFRGIMADTLEVLKQMSSNMNREPQKNC